MYNSSNAEKSGATCAAHLKSKSDSLYFGRPVNMPKWSASHILGPTEDKFRYGWYQWTSGCHGHGHSVVTACVTSWKLPDMFSTP